MNIEQQLNELEAGMRESRTALAEAERKLREITMVIDQLEANIKANGGTKDHRRYLKQFKKDRRDFQRQLASKQQEYSDYQTTLNYLKGLQA